MPGRFLSLIALLIDRFVVSRLLETSYYNVSWSASLVSNGSEQSLTPSSASRTGVAWWACFSADQGQVLGYNVTLQFEPNDAGGSKVFLKVSATSDCGESSTVDEFAKVTSWSITASLASRRNVGSVILPYGYGRRIDCRSGSCERTMAYGSDASYQILISELSNGETGFLMTLDGAGFLKTYTSNDQGTEFSVTTQLRRRLDPASLPYRSPFPTVVEVIQGDWLDVAHIYRHWAVPVFTGPKKRTWFDEEPGALWVNSHWEAEDGFAKLGGQPARVLDNIRRLRELIGTENSIALHWYEWDKLGYIDGDNYTDCPDAACGFDTHYPHYLPPRPGFGDAVDKLLDMGVRVFPYINGRLFDMQLPEWKDSVESDHACRDEHGNVISESFVSDFGVPNPDGPYWSSVIEGVCSDMMHDFPNLSGIYIDELAAAPNYACYINGRAHNWVHGINKVAIGCSNGISQWKAGVPTITESNAETMMKSVDAYLTLVAMVAADPVPVFGAVYGGHYKGVGSLFQLQSQGTPFSFTKAICQQLLFGNRIGWFALDGKDGFLSFLEDSPESVAFLRRALQIRSMFSLWFDHGRPERQYGRYKQEWVYENAFLHLKSYMTITCQPLESSDTPVEELVYGEMSTVNVASEKGIMSIPLLGSSKSFLVGSGHLPGGLAASTENTSEKTLSIRVAQLITALQRTAEGVAKGDIRQASRSSSPPLCLFVDISLMAFFTEVVYPCRLEEVHEASDLASERKSRFVTPAYRLWHVCISLSKHIDEFKSAAVEEAVIIKLRELDCICREVAARALEFGTREMLNSGGDDEETRSQRDNLIKIWLRTGQSWLSLSSGGPEEWAAANAALTRGITIFKKAVTELSEEVVSETTKNAAYSGALHLAQGLCLTGSWDGAVQTISSCRSLLSNWTGYRRIEAELELAYQCRDIGIRMVRARSSANGNDWAIGLPGWSSSAVPTPPPELSKVVELLECSVDVLSEGSSPRMDLETTVLMQLSKARSEIRRLLAEVHSMQRQPEKALELVQVAIREDIQHKAFGGYYDSVRVAVWIVLNAQPKMIKAGTTEELIKTGELKRLVEEYCAAGDEVPQEFQSSPSDRLFNLGEPLLHALVTLSEDTSPVDGSSARLDEILEALSLVLQSLQRDCDGPSLILLAASVADAIGTISRAIPRGEGKNDGKQGSVRLRDTASNGLSNVLRDIVVLMSGKNIWVDEEVKSQCSGIVWNMAAGLYTCGHYVAASTWFELCLQTVDEDSKYRCWQAQALCSYRSAAYEEGIRLSKEALRLCPDATAKSQPLLAMVNCAIDGRLTTTIAEIISELEELSLSEDQNLSPQLLVSVMNKLDGLEDARQYVPRCLKLVGQCLCKGSDGTPVDLLDRLTIFRCIAKNAIDAGDHSAALHYLEASCEGLMQDGLESCGSEQDRVIEQVAAMFRIGWNLGVQLGNNEDQEPEAWDAAFRALRCARMLIRRFLLPYEKSRVDPSEEDSGKLADDARMCLVFMLTAVTRMAMRMEEAGQTPTEVPAAETAESEIDSLCEVRSLKNLSVTELYKVGLALLGSASATEENTEMEGSRCQPLILLFEFKCTVGALSDPPSAGKRLLEAKRILESARTRGIASNDWLEILTSWCLNRRPPALDVAGVVLSVLTSSPSEAGKMLPVYYRERLRAQEGADDSTLQVLGDLLVFLDDIVKSNGVASLEEVGYRAEEVKWLLCYSWDRAVLLYRSHSLGKLAAASSLTVHILRSFHS
ncbi:hypothetical protein FOZ61_004234 [Perkinsus olseni]|uniref:DUF6259 domain-containing protein n=1 Tax=Perkinsus olseni TaxID=32597 RepID=A0A7J6LLM6_PEROL|nr:hypothetical protein FOZ61_004234 [Perkinsus olseni]